MFNINCRRLTIHQSTLRTHKTRWSVMLDVSAINQRPCYSWTRNPHCKKHEQRRATPQSTPVKQRREEADTPLKEILLHLTVAIVRNVVKLPHHAHIVRIIWLETTAWRVCESRMTSKYTQDACPSPQWLKPTPTTPDWVRKRIKCQWQRVYQSAMTPN